MDPARSAARTLVACCAAFSAWSAAAPDATVSRATSLIAEALKVPSAWARLAGLTDRIGNRLAGSAAEAKAVAWAKAEFEKDGIPVHLEPVKEVIWVRGKESAEIVAPVERPLVILGLGGTIATPLEGITAPVIAVGSFDELNALGKSKVEGKIVLFDNPFVRTGDEMKDYGEAVKFRAGGASAAAKLGAVAVLVRSVATATLRTPHTGGTWYAKDVPKIPAATATIEDSLLIRRLLAAGEEVRVRLSLDDRTLSDADGWNVVGEIRGRERPEEIVVIGAHLDSWDVGDGAIDDGAGCATVLETMRLISSGLPPRRTVRAVLFANEENGGGGGTGYAQSHKDELAKHVAAIESDSGGGRARGFSVHAGDGGVEALSDWLTPVLAPIGAARIREGEGGADIGHMEPFGVPQIGLEPDTTRYFDWHHTMADTLDKIVPEELQHAAAALAAATWVLADGEKTLPRVPPPPPEPKK